MVLSLAVLTAREAVAAAGDGTDRPVLADPGVAHRVAHPSRGVPHDWRDQPATASTVPVSACRESPAENAHLPSPTPHALAPLCLSAPRSCLRWAGRRASAAPVPTPTS